MLNLPSSWHTAIRISSKVGLREYIRTYKDLEPMTYEMLSEEKYRWGFEKESGIHISTKIGGLNDLEI